MKKVQKLQKGDTIGVISPSAPLAGMVEHRYKNGIKKLKELGYKIKIGKQALKTIPYTAGEEEDRAQDIMEFVRDKEVKAIISFIGGYNTNQLLKYLDFEIIKKNPKIIMGYSDMTILLLSIHKKCGFSTFYGPSVLNQFADPFLPEYTIDYFRKAVIKKEPIGDIHPSEKWTCEFLDWFEHKDLKRNRKYLKNPGWEWLKEGTSEGILLGGCLETLVHLRGTEYWPDFNNSILFLETCESCGSPTKGEEIGIIDSYLVDLELSGVFNNISGMIIGIPYGYEDEQKEVYKKMIITRMKDYEFPILFNVNIGHCDPIITVPIGAKAKINSKTNTFKIIESAVE